MIWVVAGILFLILLAGVGLSVWPRARKFLHPNDDRHRMPSPAESRVGMAGVVTVSLDPISHLGRVKVGDQDWAAKGTTGAPVGSKVIVTSTDGIQLLVKLES